MAWRTDSIRQIARERIDILLHLARQTFPRNPTLSKRYVELARLIGMKSGVRLPREAKAFICDNCGTILVPGNNCRVRLRSETGTTVLITCLECGCKKRFPTVRERLSNRMNRLKIRSRVTEPTIWVGKEGVTQRLLEQVEKQLGSRQLVKLKVQKSTATKSETINVAKEVSTATESTIVDVIGHTFTLYKKKSESKITLKQGST